MKLVIFDLDQTLVDFITIHDETTLELFRRFFGVDARLTDIDFAGRSLADNFGELARRKNVPADKFSEKLPELLDNYERIFAEKMPQDASRYILPGVKELLIELDKTDNFIVLYTGDSSGTVDTVFQATGLGKYFRFSQYGTEVKTRTEMARKAIEKAAALTRRKFSGKDIVIIGDSVRDIDCGKEFNALTIAVATGFHSAEELAAHKPDYLFKSLKDYRKVLKAISGTSKWVSLVDIIRMIVFVLIALILGLFGASLLFSDLGPGETMTRRLIMAVVFFFLSGLVVSYFTPKFWLLGGLVSWGGALLGFGGLLRGPTTETVIYLLPSIAPAFIGGYLGGVVGRRQLLGKLVRRLFRRG